MNKAILFAALLGVLMPSAYALDTKDQGDYVLVDIYGKPTTMQMRFKLQGSQWIMDGRKGNGAWQHVCSGTGECRLVHSSAHKVAQYQSYLPNKWANYSFECIENTAFAFCRATQTTQPSQRNYFWFPLMPQAIGKVLLLERLN